MQQQETAGSQSTPLKVVPIPLVDKAAKLTCRQAFLKHLENGVAYSQADIRMRLAAQGYHLGTITGTFYDLKNKGNFAPSVQEGKWIFNPTPELTKVLEKVPTKKVPNPVFQAAQLSVPEDDEVTLRILSQVVTVDKAKEVYNHLHRIFGR